MAYEFKPYKSVYRDPQSVKVSEILTKRYMENFASDSMLHKGLTEMLVAAEFAGDVEKADALRAKLEQSSAARTERGDFENLGMSVNMDVRDFQTNYEPLRQNYAVREKDKETKRQLIGKPGGITSGQYDAWEKRSALQTDSETGDYTSYRGIQYKDDGTYDRGSLYQPQSIAHNVNVDKEILIALQAIVSEKGGGHVKRIPQMVDTTGDGVADTEYAYRTKSGTWEKVAPEDIRKVTNEVLNRANVKAFMEQESDFSTFEMNEDELDGALITRVKQLKGKLGSGKMSETEEAEARRQITLLENAVESENTGTKRSLARGAHYADRTEALHDMAIDARGVNDYYDSAEELIYQRTLPPPVAAVIMPDPLASVTGGVQTVASPLINNDENSETYSNGQVTEESATAMVLAANTAAITTATSIFEEYPTVAANFSGYISGGEDQLLEMLDHMTTVEINNKIDEMQFKVDAEGNPLLQDSPDVIKNKFITAKRQREHYLALNEIQDDLFNTARERVRVGNAEAGIPGEIVYPTDWENNMQFNEDIKSLDQSLNLRTITGEVRPPGGYTAPEDGSSSYIQSIAAKMLNSFDRPEPNIVGWVDVHGDRGPLQEEHPQYGNIIDHVYHALRVGDTERLTREQVEAIYEDLAEARTNPDYTSVHLQGHNPTIGVPSVVESFEAALERGREATIGKINEFAQGNMTYPIQARPSYLPEEKWDEFIEAAQTIPWESLMQRSTTSGESIGTVLENNEVGITRGGSIKGVNVTWAGDPNTGIPTPAFLLKFDVYKKIGGTYKKGESTVTVRPNMLIANAPGVVEGFGLNTLSNSIMSLVFASYNMAPGLVDPQNGGTGKIKVPFNDGKANDVYLDFDVNLVDFTDSEGNTKQSLDLTSGNVKMTGQILGPDGGIIHLDGKTVTFREFQKSFDALGVRMTLPGDLAAAGLVLKEEEFDMGLD